MKRLLALVLLATFVLASPSYALKALFDDAHAEDAGNADWVIDDNMPTPSPAQSGITSTTGGDFWTGAISSYGVDLVKRGYTVATNTSTITYGNSSNIYDLSNYDVFIVPEPNTLFSAAEVTAILNFVHDGGGLIAISDHSGSDRNNDGYDSPMIWNAVDPSHTIFGVHFGVSSDANNNITQTSTNVATSATDSITHAISGNVGTVTGLAFHNGTTLTLYPSSNATVRGEVWMTGTAQSSATGVMAASCQYGSGRVFFICDSSPVDDGSARSGNTSIYDGWGEAGATDSTLFLNATLWATRRNAGASDLTPPTVTITSPVGGEAWKAGSSHAITWTATDNVGVTTVDVKYSIDGGSTYTTIASGLSNTGTYSWTVANAPGTTTRCAVTAHDASGNTGTSVSPANFTIDRWTITPSAGAGGTITPSAVVYLAQGQGQNFTIAANTGYHVASVLVDGSSVGAVSSYSFSSVSANHTIAASFAINTFTITASAGAGGGITPSGAVSVNYGASQAFAIAPNTGYSIAAVTVDGSSQGAITGYTFSNVTAAHTIAASFAINTFTITASAGAGGGITPSGAVSVNYGASQAFAIAPNAGYGIADVQVDGASAGAVAGYTFSNVTASHTIAASFAINTFTITASAGAGGGITPGGAVSVNYGASQAFAIAPNAGYGIADVQVDGASAGAVAGYTFSNVTASHTITATFADVAAPTVTVLTPNGGESWTAGDAHDITWSAADNAGVTSVTLEYSTAGGAGPWTTIATSLANTGTYSWTVPNDVSTTASVRVTAADAATNAASDTSDAVFEIASSTAGVGAGPAALSLSRPTPNPSGGATQLTFSLPVSGRAHVDVIDASGRRIAGLAGEFSAGAHVWTWDGRLADGSRAGAGLYFVRLTTPSGTRLQRMVRLR